MRIDRIAATGAPLANVVTFNSRTRVDGARIRVHKRRGYYIVRWRTDDYDLSTTATYRITVLVDGHTLGFADIDVVRTSRELRNVDINQYVPLKLDSTLAIKFRIETQAIDRDGDGIADWRDNCPDVANGPGLPPAPAGASHAVPPGCDNEWNECDEDEGDCDHDGGGGGGGSAQVDTDGDGIGDACECATGAFGPRTDFPTGTDDFSVALADFNADGRLDLATANRTADSVSVLLNTTAAEATVPSFAGKVDFATGPSPFSLAVDDLNGDGKPDVAVTNFGDNTVSVLLNTTVAGAPTATFAAKVDFSTGPNPFNLSIGDLNGDGRADLVVPNQSGTTVSVLLNTAAPGAPVPSFAPTVDFPAGARPETAAIADLNRDGKPDLGVVNYNSNTLSVLLGTTATGATAPSFAAPVDFGAGAGAYFVASADLNGDGKPDLAVGNVESDTVSVFLNTTSPLAAVPSFAAKVDFAGPNPHSIAIADLDGCGQPDLVTANEAFGTVSVLRNTTAAGATAPSFAAKVDYPVGQDPTSVAIGDMNGDGKPDLVVASRGNHIISVLLGL